MAFYEVPRLAPDVEEALLKVDISRFKVRHLICSEPCLIGRGYYGIEAGAVLASHIKQPPYIVY